VQVTYRFKNNGLKIVTLTFKSRDYASLKQIFIDRYGVQLPNWRCHESRKLDGRQVGLLG
jgi:hypothetical protein